MTTTEPRNRADDTLETSTFPSPVDRTPIFFRRWLPPGGEAPLAAVLITHGMAEHSGRYDRFARFLTGHSCVVYALDLRGHGQTAGPGRLGQGGLSTWDDMTADIAGLADKIRAEHPAVPLIAFGHSMGSALTQFHLQHYGDRLAGGILCGTLGAFPGIDDAGYERLIGELRGLATGADAGAPSRFFAELLGRFNAPFAGTVAHPTGSEWQTSDVEEIRRFRADPLCGRPFSNSLTYSVVEGFHRLWRPENELRIPADLPILIVAGTEDPVGDRTITIQALITRYMSQGHRTLDYRFYAGGRHELLNDVQRDWVHRDIADWLEGCLARSLTPAVRR